MVRESVSSSPIVRIFGKGKCKFIANFSATIVTSLPSLSLSLSVCNYRKRGSVSYIVREVHSVRERERERYRERKDGSDVTIVALKLAMSFALLLAKNVHLSIGEEFCAFPCQKICTSVSPSTLSVAKNVALFETVRILRTVKWRDPSTLLSPSLHSPQHLTPATLFLDSSIPLCSFISLSYSFLVH